MNHKLSSKETRKGVFTVSQNLIDVVVKSDKSKFDATLALFSYDKACRLSSVSISATNTFLKDKLGESIDDEDLFEWEKATDKKLHLWADMSMFETIMYLKGDFTPINHLLNLDPNWLDYIRGFIYVIYFPKAKEYEFVLKCGKADNWYGRTKNYEHDHGYFEVIAIFFVKFTSPAEDLLKKIEAEEFGAPLSVKGKSEEAKKKNLGKEYFKVKAKEDEETIETNKQAISRIIEVVKKWVEAMPTDEILDTYWVYQSQLSFLCTLTLEGYINGFRLRKKIEELEELEKPNVEQKKALDLLNRQLRFRASAEHELLCMIREQSINDFVKKCKPKAKVSQVILPFDVKC